jgi:hypothetical protein
MSMSFAHAGGVAAQVTEASRQQRESLERLNRESRIGPPDASYGRIQLNLPQRGGSSGPAPARNAAIVDRVNEYWLWRQSQLPPDPVAEAEAREARARAARAYRSFVVYDSTHLAWVISQLRRLPQPAPSAEAQASRWATIARLSAPLDDAVLAFADSAASLHPAEYGILALGVRYGYASDTRRGWSLETGPAIMATNLVSMMDFPPFRALACAWTKYRTTSYSGLWNTQTAVAAKLHETRSQECYAALDAPTRALADVIEEVTNDADPQKSWLHDRTGGNCAETTEMLMASRDFWRGTNDGRDLNAVRARLRQAPSMRRKHPFGCEPAAR